MYIHIALLNINPVSIPQAYQLDKLSPLSSLDT